MVICGVVISLKGSKAVFTWAILIKQFKADPMIQSTTKLLMEKWSASSQLTLTTQVRIPTKISLCC